MKIKNYDIYSYALQIGKESSENDGNIDFDVPIIINFYIQKNIEQIIKAATTIDKSRNFIIKKYQDNNLISEQQEEIQIKKEFILEAQKDLDDLMNIEQEINIVKIKLSELKNCHLTTRQLKIILFMIEDDINQESKEDD